MSALALKCPLCCDEQFSSYDSLKYHLLGVAENILCPACDTRFENILELADHIGRECKEKEADSVVTHIDVASIKKETSQEAVFLKSGIGTVAPIMDEESSLEVNMAQPSDDHDQESVAPDTLSDTDADCTYLCEMCNVEFTSVEDHLEKYHDGEDVFMEPGGDGAGDEDVRNEETEETVEDNNFEIVESSDSQNELDMDLPQEVSDDDGTKKNQQDGEIRQPKEHWTNELVNDIPITDYYVVDGNKIEKISEEAASRIEDRASVIEIHQCPRCYLQFPKMDHYVKHLCNPDRSNDKFKCAHCSAVFHSYQSLNAHMRMHIPKDADAKEKRIVTLGPHTCDVCDTMFPTFKSMKLHQRMHDPKAVADKCRGALTPGAATTGVLRQMFVCNICAMTYDKQYEEIHMRSHRGEENYNCTTCNRKFHTKENLEMHARAHNNAKKFSCSYCKKPFATYEALQEHVADECRNRDFECKHCGRRFVRHHEKAKHERIHTGEKPHVCQICGKSFRVSYCLTLHLRTHSGARPYECAHCGKRFKSHSVYNHHLLTHSEVRAYRCPYCPKAFKTPVQLAGHRNSHTKPFTCKECNRPFASLYAVRAHMDTHKRDNSLKFDCPVCGATYARDFALRDHMKSQHPVAGAAETADVAGIDSTETFESTARLEHEMDAEDEESRGG